MARSYRDAVELAVEAAGPLGMSRLIPPDAVIVRGAVSIGAPEPVPLILLPGYEYRVRRLDDDDGWVWIIERRTVGAGGGDG